MKSWKSALLLKLLLVSLSYAAAAATVGSINVSAVSIENDVLQFSYQLGQLLDTEKQPCQDFYGYVCARSSIPSQTMREQQRQTEQQRFTQLLSADSAGNEQLLDMEIKLKNFHTSCENNRKSVDTLKNSLLYKLSGGWPALETTAAATAAAAAQRKNHTWLGMLASFHEIGVPYIFETDINIRSNKRIVQLQPDTTTRHTMRKFEQLLGEVLRSYGVEQSRSPVLALEVLSLERSRREIVKMEVPDNQTELAYSSFKQSAFHNLTRAIDWDAYFKKVLGKTLQPNDIIVIKQLPRLSAYFQLLQSTSLPRLLNWIWIDYLMDVSASSCQQLAEQHMPEVYEHLVQRANVDRAQMAQLYATIGRAYKEQLASTVWIDEISQQSSQLFLGRIMHLTVSGDEKLNEAHRDLLIGKRNFYRNLEKLQHFQAQQRKRQLAQTTNAGTAQAVKDYMQIFRTLNVLLDTRNLSTPLNYMLVAEHFASSLLAAGSSSRTPGAWRSMDSERKFASFERCTARGLDAASLARLNANDLLLALLAQQQAWRCYTQWLSQQSGQLQPRLNSLLAVGRLKLSLKRLYFIGNLLVACGHGSAQQERKRQLLHTALRNSPEFSEAFECRAGDALYAQQRCSTA